MPLTNKERIQISIIAVVLILGVLRIINLFTRRVIPAQAGIQVVDPRFRGGDIPINADPLTSTVVKQSIDLSPLPDRAAQSSRSKQRWGRDPFFGLPIEDNAFHESTSDQPSDELVLSGISLKGNRAMAIVNRTIVREGDEAFGMRVLAIERDRVVFAKNSHEVILRIGTSQ